MAIRHKLHYIKKMGSRIRKKQKKLAKSSAYSPQKTIVTSSVNVLQYKEFKSNYDILFDKLASRMPLLLKGVTPPQYNIPERVHVMVSEEGNKDLHPVVIPY